MLTIAIDATSLTIQPSGIGLYVYNLIYTLYALQNSENFQMRIVYQPRLKNWLMGRLIATNLINLDTQVYTLPVPVSVSHILSKFPNPIISYYENYLGFPDIIHGTDHVVYPCAKSLKIMTIHDLTYIKYPNFVNWIVRSYTDRIRQCLKWTDLIITVSESSKKDIIEYFQVEPEKIYVTPLASRYNPDYLSAENILNIEKQVEHDFSQPYLLFVSTIEPRKNINAVILAFNFLKTKYKIEHQLVLIGKKGWKYEPIFMAIENSHWKNQIHHFDYLSDELVALFYSRADVFVYPSHYEGFGLPILEAMMLGTPVVTSNTSSIPEVTGDAAILIDPNDPIQLAEAILKVISDSQLRQDLIEKGKARAKLFSWERTAKETLKAYRSIL
ncbi:glycosyltransferase family 1 protein [Nostoc sp. CHAB 5715]|uniref:glycosyltransferase family 4 protein n=1 Tax=Nostoc sp. CHAB 5715 TaxID=2780400 RepID=UPI001E352F06|nr:glycosyltransferase family 1 protein [Nostoc sp. CHAB 5715]MCC5620836.1 glycosyltransferase family 4 protein [Nostoc sp. CHAB 5715]